MSAVIPTARSTLRFPRRAYSVARQLNTFPRLLLSVARHARGMARHLALSIKHRSNITIFSKNNFGCHTANQPPNICTIHSNTYEKNPLDLTYRCNCYDY